MRFPWQPKLETRSGGYTDALLALLIREADGGSGADNKTTAAVEAASGQIGRAFAAAEVVTDSPTVAAALTPGFLEMVGREFIRSGDVVFYLDITDGLTLIPATSHYVMGGPIPSMWTYDLSCAGPTKTYDYHNVPAASVLHFRYGSTPAQSWLGAGPITIAALSGRLSAETIRALGDELAGPVGRLIGIPVDGDDPTVASLKADITKANGRMAFMETGDWQNENGGVVTGETHRFGAEPGAPLVSLIDAASREIWAACGLSPAIWGSGDAAATREAWRLALFATLMPLGKKAAAELTLKLGTVDLEWMELKASDLQGRARSLQSMTNAGATLESAAMEAGLPHLIAAPTPAE